MADQALGVLSLVTVVVMVGVATRNLRLGRGDLSGAFRTSVVVFGLYLTVEVLSFDLGQSLVNQFAGLVWATTGAHVTLHAVLVGLIYLAFEPIARRAWPRVLIGWVRVLAGNWLDSRVGVEILIGLGVGSAVALHANLPIGENPVQVLSDNALLAFSGPVVTSCVTLHSVAAFFLLFPLLWISVLGLFQLVTRSARVALALGVVFTTVISLEEGVVWAAVSAVVTILVFVRGGFIALATSVWLPIYLSSIPLSSDLTAWYAPNTIFVAVVVGAVLAYGVWAVLRGGNRR